MRARRCLLLLTPFCIPPLGPLFRAAAACRSPPCFGPLTPKHPPPGWNRKRRRSCCAGQCNGQSQSHCNNARLHLARAGPACLAFALVLCWLEFRKASAPPPRRRPRAGASRAFGALRSEGGLSHSEPSVGGTLTAGGGGQSFLPARARHARRARPGFFGWLPASGRSLAGLLAPAAYAADARWGRPCRALAASLRMRATRALCGRVSWAGAARRLGVCASVGLPCMLPCAHR